MHGEHIKLFLSFYIIINSQPGNIQSGEDAMLRKATVKTWEMNEQGQEERLKEFNRQRDEKRKIEAARVVNPYGSCVNPPDNCHRENYPPLIYDNMPGGGNKQPTVMAIASESQDSHQFVMGSRVEFSDPPRYGEIRWMGNFPQVDGLIVGVELVSCHYIYFVCVLSHNIGGGYGGLY